MEDAKRPILAVQKTNTVECLMSTPFVISRRYVFMAGLCYLSIYLSIFLSNIEYFVHMNVCLDLLVFGRGKNCFVIMIWVGTNDLVL